MTEPDIQKTASLSDEDILVPLDDQALIEIVLARTDEKAIPVSLDDL